ncbi:acetylglutamate kinase [Portibacter marinus]|uniref:acetylglutamate kinase n=1 Tax=Portibacter marinus TaxID=2898660 RepID=UPI001F2CA5A1|nr:acetylglutamate kinase [Portibacter marinus]
MMDVINVIKIGGKVLSNPQKLHHALVSFKNVSGAKILIHGGGAEATALAKKMDVEVKMLEGRRITDEAMIEIATMIYGGLVNKRIVAGLQSMGVNALGLSGADGNTILSWKRPVKEIDYGYVGDIENVNGVALTKLLHSGFVPVFCALTHDGKGQMLNTNADTIASEIAKALSKSYDVRLYYAFELTGVLHNIEDEDSVIDRITAEGFAEMKNKGTVADGMVPKIYNAIQASKSGVKEVIIGQYTNMERPDKGTEICRS